VAPVYAQIWDTLTTAGQKVTGVGGSDSHENILPFSAHDGDRLDAHRRLLRWFSNHLLVTDLTYASIKAALVGHRSWLAFEGLGTPVGMDFYAKAGTATVGVGDTGTFVAGSTTITVPLPTLHKSSPQDGNAPTIIIRLKQVGANTDTVVATATNASLSYTVTQTGAYRAEIGIIPKHLSAWVGYRRELLNAEYPWIITNHLYLQ
ncbi:MAG: hypothetical protein ACXWPM_10280, partial [Bdellovibrionota bacterium]